MCARTCYKGKKFIGTFNSSVRIGRRQPRFYPVELVEAILRGLRSEMRKRGQINSVEEMLTGASPDDWVDQEKENQELDELFVDDSSGTVLPAELVRKARAGELDCMASQGGGLRKSSEEALRAERAEEATSTEVAGCE